MSEFYKNGLKLSARLEEKNVNKFQCEKCQPAEILQKMTGGGGDSAPALLGLILVIVYDVSHCAEGLILGLVL